METPKQDLLSRFAPGYSIWTDIGLAIGAENLDVVLRLLGPGITSVPTVDNFWESLERDLRNARIRAEFRGNNIRDLAEAYALHPRTIRKILAGCE